MAVLVRKVCLVLVNFIGKEIKLMNYISVWFVVYQYEISFLLKRSYFYRS